LSVLVGAGVAVGCGAEGIGRTVTTVRTAVGVVELGAALAVAAAAGSGSTVAGAIAAGASSRWEAVALTAWVAIGRRSVSPAGAALPSSLTRDPR
jgi:hypothetical protein